MPPPTPPADASHDAAGFWPRAAAWLIDAALVALPVTLLILLLRDDGVPSLPEQWQQLGAATGRAAMASADRGDSMAMMLQSWMSPTGPVRPAITAFVSSLYAAAWPAVALFVLIGLLYWPLQEAGRHHATFGKRALGLRVEGAEGARPGPARAYRRHVAGTLSWLTLNIGHLLAARPPGHRALHDRIAGTRVAWREDASRRVPGWGWLAIVIACVLPVVVAIWAAMSLSAAMQAAMGL